MSFNRMAQVCLPFWLRSLRASSLSITPPNRGTLSRCVAVMRRWKKTVEQNSLPDFGLPLGLA